MGDDQRAQRVLGGNSASIADHMRISRMQSQTAFKQNSGIHAGQHGEMATGPDCKITQVKVSNKFFVGFQKFVCD